MILHRFYIWFPQILHRYNIIFDEQKPDIVVIGFDRELNYQKLEKALSNLRWKYRNILELRTVQNMSYKQMSEQLGLTESQVKSLLNKAREKLKQLLN